jgi:hypothetical protein
MRNFKNFKNYVLSWKNMVFVRKYCFLQSRIWFSCENTVFCKAEYGFFGKILFSAKQNIVFLGKYCFLQSRIWFFGENTVFCKAEYGFCAKILFSAMKTDIYNNAFFLPQRTQRFHKVRKGFHILRLWRHRKLTAKNARSKASSKMSSKRRNILRLYTGQCCGR